MSNRISEILAAESIATAGTKTIDLNINDPISRITIQLRVTNNGSAPTAHPAKAVSKIEVTDGSDVLFSLSGTECAALNFYDKGFLPFSLAAYENNILATVDFHLDFGRFLWDKVLALDPNKFNNIQLRITHNKAAGGSSPDAGTLAVIAHTFDQADASPVGFLMSKEVFNYALAASGQERIVLPADYDYRKILYGALSAGNSPPSQVAKAKLSIDNDKQVLINNLNTSDLLKMLAGPKAVEALIGMGSGSEITYFIAPTYEQYVSFSPMGSALAATTTVNQGSGGQVIILNDASEAFQVLSFGYAPHGMVSLPQGDQMNPNDWLPVSRAGSVVLSLTAGSSIASAQTAQVLLQQKRTY